MGSQVCIEREFGAHGKSERVVEGPRLRRRCGRVVTVR
jgi:hypothetical protein